MNAFTPPCFGSGFTRQAALVTALLFTIGRVGIGFYLGHSKTASAFGAAAALAVLLIWIYYAAIILLLGAEFTRAWVTGHGREHRRKRGRHVRGDSSDQQHAHLPQRGQHGTGVYEHWDVQCGARR